MFKSNRSLVIRICLIAGVLMAMLISGVASAVPIIQHESASERQALVPMQKVCAAANPAADHQADLSCAAELVSAPDCVMLTKKVMAQAAFQHSGLMLTQGDADLRCNNTDAFAFDQQQGQADQPVRVTITSSTNSAEQIVVPLCANFTARDCDPSLLLARPTNTP